MRFETVIYETVGPLAWIRLNRPEKLNAMSQEMVTELNTALDQAENDEHIRVIVLAGEGRAFSAGFDLAVDNEEEHLPEQARNALIRELQNDFDLIMRFWDSPKPTIAAVHGYCLGGALEIAVACDLTVAAEDCRLGEPEVRFGSGIVAMLLPYACGPKRAKEVLLTGNDGISARQAESWGLVNRVVEADRLIPETTALAQEIARNDQLAVRLTKQAVNLSFETGRMRDALNQALELNIVIETTETEESRQFNEILKNEGVKAAIAWRDSRFE